MGVANDKSVLKTKGVLWGVKGKLQGGGGDTRKGWGKRSARPKKKERKKSKDKLLSKDNTLGKGGAKVGENEQGDRAKSRRGLKRHG